MIACGRQAAGGPRWRQRLGRARPCLLSRPLLQEGNPCDAHTPHRLALTLASSSCSADLDGSAAAANNGSTDVTYTNPRKLKILPAGGTLNAYNVTGCPGFSTSDPVAVTGAYKLTAPQSIS